MEKRRKVMLYGNSLILGTFATSLRQSPSYDVNILPAGTTNTRKIQPDVVLFDLESTNAEAAFSWLKEFPDLLLIGISPDKNLVRVWSGRQLKELSTRDLMSVINSESTEPER